MFSLVLSILCSAAVSIVMRAAQKHTRNNISMLVFNYVMCTAFACFFTVLDTGSLIPAGSGAPFAVGLGLINGCLFLAAFILLQYNISNNGVVLASTFMKLGVLVPTLAAVIFFGETPTGMQIAGFVLALAAIILINGRKEDNAASAKIMLIILLAAGGCADAMAKVYEVFGTEGLKSHFLLLTFLTALVLCVITARIKGQTVSRKDVLFGLILGVPNYLSSRLLLISLGSVPAVIAYPTFSVVTIIIVSLVSLVFFRENLSRRQWTAIGIILLALALLNI